MGTDHATILHESVSGGVVSAIADMDFDKAKSLANAVNAHPFSDGFDLINSDTVDAVIVASADVTHRDLVLACLAANKPVLSEKPLATTSEHAREIVLAEDKLGAPTPLVSVGFMRRFDPTCVELHDTVVEGKYGAALLAHSVSRGTTSGPGSTNRSALSNSAIHEIDYLPWLLGSAIAEVTTQATKLTKNVTGFQDPQLFSLRTETGIVASCELFLNARYGHDVRFEVVFEEGAVATVEPINTMVSSALSASTSLGPDWRRRWRNAYRIELQAWIDSIATGKPNPAMATARDGLASLLVVDALIKSQELGGAATAVIQVSDFLR
jgi:myo-inositol 2-dehydrogenase/D-chiro-inositol 1-dehydrogenase